VARYRVSATCLGPRQPVPAQVGRSHDAGSSRQSNGGTPRARPRGSAWPGDTSFTGERSCCGPVGLACRCVGGASCCWSRALPHAVRRLLFNVLAMVAEFESGPTRLRIREGMRSPRPRAGSVASSPSSTVARKRTWSRAGRRVHAHPHRRAATVPGRTHRGTRLGGGDRPGDQHAPRRVHPGPDRATGHRHRRRHGTAHSRWGGPAPC
jgi:hypothetical protein